MKKLYFRPQKISSVGLTCLAVFAIGVVVGLHQFPDRFAVFERWKGAAMGVPDLQDRMLDAASRADLAFEAIHCRRVQLGHKMLDIHDPADTGMLGPSMSLVTSLPGHLDAKQTSINPNFGAVATRLLVEAGVRPGDRIAIGCTGSLPGFDIAVYAAAEALDLRPVVISSAASSQYGANEPDLMWPDMEKLLHDEGIFSIRSSMISRGGFKDRAAGMTDDTREILEASIHRSGVPLMDSQDGAHAIELRMLTYSEEAEDETFAAYVNVGGGDASVAGTLGNDLLGEGVIYPSQLSRVHRMVADPNEIDCVATRFLASDVPVINMINAVKLAKRYGLPVSSDEPVIVGDGNVYAIFSVRRVLAVLGIILIMLATALVVRPPHRLVEAWRRRGWYGTDSNAQPQMMV